MVKEKLLHYTKLSGLKFKFGTCTFLYGHLCYIFQFSKTAVTYQKGPGGFVVAVTHASDFGLLYFMTVDPTP